MTVYFAEKDGLIKIGCSSNVNARMATLGARLLATLPGEYRLEGIMHSWFHDLRVEGEWFHPGVRLMTFIGALNTADQKVCLSVPLWAPPLDARSQLLRDLGVRELSDESEVA